MTLSKEKRRTKIKFNKPYAKALEKFRVKASPREDYDPASLILFHNMMSLAAVEIFKAMERQFGVIGQKVCSDAMTKVGFDVIKQCLKSVEIPHDLSPVEATSIFYTMGNEMLAASVEDPHIESENACSFDIHFCPLQEIYEPLDCRIQRYWMQGFLDAASSKLPVRKFNVTVEQLIPKGDDTCRFRMWKKNDSESDTWDEYTEFINQKALKYAVPGKPTRLNPIEGKEPELPPKKKNLEKTKFKIPFARSMEKLRQIALPREEFIFCRPDWGRACSGWPCWIYGFKLPPGRE